MNSEIKVLLFANSSWYMHNFWLSNIEIFKSAKYNVILVSNDDGYGTSLMEKGYIFYNLNVSRGIKGLFGDIKILFKLRTIIKEVGPDIIHNLNPKPVLYTSTLLFFMKAFGYNKKILIINSFPGLGRLYSNSSLLFLALRIIFEKTYQFISKYSNVKSVFQVSSDREYFLQKNIVSKKSSFVIKGSGVNIKNFSPKNRSKKNSQLRVLMASRMTVEKGVYLYLSACKEINKRYDNVSFFLAGKTDENEPDLIPYKKLIDLCNNSNVNYLGHVDKMSELLRTIDIVVLPTSRREGVPRILVESAASGVSLIASNIGGCADVVHHKVNGFLINQNSLEELIDSLEKLIINNELLLQYCLASREIVQKEMNSTFVANAYIDIYKMINLRGNYD